MNAILTMFLSYSHFQDWPLTLEFINTTRSVTSDHSPWLRWSVRSNQLAESVLYESPTQLDMLKPMNQTVVTTNTIRLTGLYVLNDNELNRFVIAEDDHKINT